jgi:toxin ParE1/3/4
VARSRVVWSAAAAADAEAIAVFIARDSRRYAAAVAEGLLESAAGLADFPLSGRVVPELGDESISEIFVYSWRLIYRVDPGVVTLATILHQRQHFQPSTVRPR